MNALLLTNWTVARLGDLANAIQYGYTESAQQDNVGPKFLRITDIQNDIVDWSSVPFCVIDNEKKEKYLLREGDLVFARTGATVGKSFLVTGPIPESVFASYLIRVRLRPEIEPKYVSYFFRSPDYWRQISESRAGIGQPNVNGKKLGQIQIPVAPLDQQKRIVAEIEKQFSRLDEAVTNLRRVKANLKRYKAAVLKAAVEGRLVETEAELARREGRSYETGEQLLQTALETRRSQWKGKAKYKGPAPPDTANLLELPEGWVWVISEVIFDFVTSGSRGWAKYYSEAGSVFLRVGNLDHGTIDLDLSEVQHVTPPSGPEADRSRVRPGDLLISITAELGMVAVAPGNLGDAYINQHVAIARSTDLIDKNYMGWYFACEHAGKKQLESLRRGATKAGLGLDDIRSVFVALPPLTEQHRIVAEVDRRLSLIREVETQVDIKLQRSKRLRQSILNRAFSGKLIKSNANAEAGSWPDWSMAVQPYAIYKSKA